MVEPVLDQEVLTLFVEETRERLESLEPALVELEQTSESERVRLVNEIFRHLHSTKGNAGYLGLSELVHLVHAAEQLADALRNGAALQPQHVDLLLQTTSYLRACLVALLAGSLLPAGLDVLADQLEAVALSARDTASATPPVAPVTEAIAAEPAAAKAVVTGPAASASVPPAASPAAKRNGADAGETGRAAGRDEGGDARTGADAELFASTVRVPVEVLGQLGRLAEEMLVTRNRLTSLATAIQDRELAGASKKLSVMVSELQDIATLTRLQPISSLFSQMPRVARDAARATGKDVDLVVDGGKLEIDRRILQELRDPLVHLLRNAVDHGLEGPDQRLAAGKSARGRLRLTATREGSNLVLEVEDDGGGIDYAAVRAKGVERSLISAREAATLGDTDLVRLLLRPGFSTRDSATAMSGRGVGLDVVATRMQELGGSLDIESVRGQGTTVRLSVATSVSVVNTLVFTARGYLLGLPYNVVQEIVLIDEGQVERYGTQEVFRLRNQLITLFTLENWPERHAEPSSRSKRYVLVLRHHQAVAGLWCDGIARFEELIVKPVGNVIRGVDVVTGLASLGTGEIVLILEPEKLLAEAGLAAGSDHDGERNDLDLGETGKGESEDAAERMILVRGHGDYRYALPVRLVSRIVRFTSADLVPVGNHTYLRQADGLLPHISLDQDLGLGSEQPSAGIALLMGPADRQAALSVAQVVRIGPVTARPAHSDYPNVTGMLDLADGMYLIVDVEHLLRQQEGRDAAVAELAAVAAVTGANGAHTHRIALGAAPAVVDEQRDHVLAVNLGSEVYGMPVAQVREITMLDGLTATPLSRVGVLGLANIRGEILPVFDLGGVLERPERVATGRPVDVVVVTGLGPMVLRSDAIRGTIKVATSELREPHGQLGALGELVRAVVTLPDCLLEVLDLEKIAGRCLGWR